MPLIGTMEIVVVAAGLLVLLVVPAVFAAIDDRRARAAAVTVPALGSGPAEGSSDHLPFSSSVAPDGADDSADRSAAPGGAAVDVARDPRGRTEP